MNGKECWYVVDGYRPPVSEGEVKTIGVMNAI